jgi:hypothetical protein
VRNHISKKKKKNSGQKNTDGSCHACFILWTPCGFAGLKTALADYREEGWGAKSKSVREEWGRIKRDAFTGSESILRVIP